MGNNPREKSFTCPKGSAAGRQSKQTGPEPGGGWAATRGERGLHAQRVAPREALQSAPGSPGVFIKEEENYVHDHGTFQMPYSYGRI